jgi:hypothetical protein
MQQIYHPYYVWECYPAGFYEIHTPSGLTEQDALLAYGIFLCDNPRFTCALERVITEWPHSCEQYLSNETLNRIAWLGQAAMCIDTGISNRYRGGFNLLTPTEQETANRTALDALNRWLARRGEPIVDMRKAGVNVKKYNTLDTIQ